MLVTAPNIMPRISGREMLLENRKYSEIVIKRLNPTASIIKPVSSNPLLLKVAKKDGPTCRPIKKTKRTRPKFLKNAIIAGSTLTPA